MCIISLLLLIGMAFPISLWILLPPLITGDYTQNASCYYSTTTFNSSLRYQSDSIDASSSATGTTAVNRSNMQFIMAPTVVTNHPIRQF